MAVVKILEIISEGASVEDAIKSAVDEAAKTVQNILQINVEHIAAIVENNKVKKFRVNTKLSFLINDHERDEKKKNNGKKKK